MIKTNNNRKILEFGKGDIHIQAGATEKGDKLLGLVVFNSQNPPRQIGNNPEWEKGHSEEVELETYEVVMIFEKVESIDVLINNLNHAKEKMIDTKKDIKELSQEEPQK